MTYFGFLIRFIGIPLLILAVLTAWDWHKGRRLPDDLRKQPAWLALLAHVIAAVVWTTPWDNYLVATGVWYYDPNLVTGITLGWVPIEEYTFFVVQTLMTGLWLLWLGQAAADRVAADPAAAAPAPECDVRRDRHLAGVRRALAGGLGGGHVPRAGGRLAWTADHPATGGGRRRPVAPPPAGRGRAAAAVALPVGRRLSWRSAPARGPSTRRRRPGSCWAACCRSKKSSSSC